MWFQQFCEITPSNVRLHMVYKQSMVPSKCHRTQLWTNNTVHGTPLHDFILVYSVLYHSATYLVTFFTKQQRILKSSISLSHCFNQWDDNELCIGYFQQDRTTCYTTVTTIKIIESYPRDFGHQGHLTLPTRFLMRHAEGKGVS